MRKINKKLITMILTLLLTLIAFVTSLYAWFVDNDSTDASIIGSSSNNGMTLTSKIYSLTNNGSDYIIGNEISQMNKYNNDDSACTAVLLEMKIELEKNTSCSAYIKTDKGMPNSSSDFPKIGNDTDSIYQTEISNTIHLYEVTKNGTNISINGNELSFINSAVNPYTKNTSIELKTNINESQTLYFLIDYSDKNIDIIYSKLITFTQANINSEMIFKEDLYLELIKA